MYHYDNFNNKKINIVYKLYIIKYINRSEKLMEINICKLIDSIEEKREISEDDLLVRELLEICYKNSSKISTIDLKKFNYRIFKKAYDEIMKTDYENMNIIKDMIKIEFFSENLDSIYPIDDDDIY